MKYYKIAFVKLIGVFSLMGVLMVGVQGCWRNNRPAAAIVEFAGIPFGSQQKEWNVKALTGFDRPKIHVTPKTKRAYKVEISPESYFYRGNDDMEKAIRHIIAILNEKYPSCVSHFTGKKLRVDENSRELAFWELEDNLRHGRKIIIYRKPRVQQHKRKEFGNSGDVLADVVNSRMIEESVDSGGFEWARIVAIDEQLMEQAKQEQNQLDKEAL